MTNTITFPGLLIDQAKEVLAAVYNADKSAAYNNDLQLHGSTIDAEITKNEEKSNGSTLTWWDVNINSTYFSAATLNEMFTDQIYKYC